MDNLTHALIGFATAEAALSLYARGNQNKEQESTSSKSLTINKLRPWFWFVSAAANNVPDLDFVYSWVSRTESVKNLGYLLHHRGYTHTLLAAIPFAFFLTLLLKVIDKRSLFPRGWFVALGTFGVCTHILADSWNSYGVHPFWPFYSQWFYSDSIFIVEPWIWSLLAGGLLTRATSKPGKLGLGSIALLGIFLSWFTGLVPIVPAAILTLTSASVLIASTSLFKESKSFFPMMVALLCVILCGFHLMSAKVKRDIVQTLSNAGFPEGSEIHDTVLSPAPANPFCWMGLAIGVEGGPTKNYFILRFIAAPYPNFVSGLDCENIRSYEPDSTSSPVSNANLVNRPYLIWQGEYRRPLSELQQLAKDNCVVQEFLKFSRAPFWIPQSDGRTYLGDARFDREKGQSFAEFWVDATTAQEKCPKHTPNWIPPRRELF